MDSDWTFGVMLRWQWWLVVIVLSPVIVFVITFMLLEYIFDYLSDACFSISRLFGRVANFKTPPIFASMLKFAKGK